MGRRTVERVLVPAPAFQQDVDRNMVRLQVGDRKGIPEGRICVVKANGQAHPLIVRGVASTAATGFIMMDELTRESFGVTENHPYLFEIRQANLFQRLWWSATVADPGVRIAAWLGLASLAIALLSLVLALIPLLQSFTSH
jgi:hypothetical protein